MHSFPHRYYADADAQPEKSVVTVSSPELTSLETTTPPEFDGPGGYWSPETLLVAAVSDCFILTFRGIAKANKFEWTRLQAQTEGVLDRVDRVTRFTEFHLTATLHVPPGVDEDKARRLLEKAKQSCLITNSFIADTLLDVAIRVDEVEPLPA